MKVNTLQSLLSIVLLHLSIVSFAQNSPTEIGVYVHNLNSFSVQSNEYYIEAVKINKDFESHPELGRLPFNFTAYTNVVEDLSERTANTRKFINVNNPSEFHIQQFQTPAHILKDGYWQTLDHRIQPTSIQNIYEVKNHYDY